MQEYLTVSTAASFLGVSPSTLRNWDREGKLKAIRHPINRYRLYSKRELQRFLKSMRSK
jgi:excisionase family DNA binding protein